ncbi:MAG: glycosyltransferase [Candidatus Thermoplasmatota archaeon]|nr:glycosyltransferase [Candidatus Thermoplasmatota archaeon]
MVSTFYPPYHLGGDATHVQYLAQALSERGHEVHVEFSPAAYNLKRKGDPASATIEHDGIRLHPIPSPYGRMQPIAAHVLGRSKSVTRFHEDLMKRIRPDVVHFHNISLLGLGVLGQTHTPRTLYTAHDYWIRCPRSDLFKYGRYPCDAPTCTRCALVSRRPPQVWRTERAWRDFRKVDCVIAPSRFMAEAIEQEVTCPIVHIPNFAPDQNPDGPTWEPRDYYLYVGDHHVRKGVMELAHAASMRPEALSVVFVGHGRDERRLRGLQEKKLADIDVKGWVSPLELTRLYRKARALIIPSLWHDNSPLVGIEALSWGTPLLVSRRGGLEELTSGGEAGSSFEPRAADILSTLDGFEEEGLPQRLREPARRAYEAHHDPDVYLEEYMSVTEGGMESLQEAKAPSR